MAQRISEPADLDARCARARPWVRRFVEEYADGRPWGYALYQDPTIDDEIMEECMCRLDNLIWCAQDAVYGRGHEGFPRFQFEYLDWPEGEPESYVPKQDTATRSLEAVSNVDAHETSGDAKANASAKDSLEDEANSSTEDSADDEDDADIETVRELNKLRAHFKWVRDRATKIRLPHHPLDGDRSGIPRGLARNVFLVIDQDVVDSITASRSAADFAWIWAVDPDYTGTVDSMTKNGLKDEYHGYMRVRVQQLVNNFWDARHYHEDEQPFSALWTAAQQSHDYAFTSLDPAEAHNFGGGFNEGSALRVSTG